MLGPTRAKGFGALAVLALVSTGCGSSQPSTLSSSSVSPAVMRCISNAKSGLDSLQRYSVINQQSQIDAVLSALAIHYGNVGGNTSRTFQIIYDAYHRWLSSTLGLHRSSSTDMNRFIYEQCTDAFGGAQAPTTTTSGSRNPSIPNRSSGSDSSTSPVQPSTTTTSPVAGTVPDLVGLDAVDATSLLNSVDMLSDVVDYTQPTCPLPIPAGHDDVVTSQSPPAGTVLPPSDWETIVTLQDCTIGSP